MDINGAGSFLRGARINPLPDFNPSRCSIKCSLVYVLEPVVTHGPGCSSAPDAASGTTGSTHMETKTSTTEEAPIAHQ